MPIVRPQRDAIERLLRKQGGTSTIWPRIQRIPSCRFFVSGPAGSQELILLGVSAVTGSERARLSTPVAVFGKCGNGGLALHRVTDARARVCQHAVLLRDTTAEESALPDSHKAVVLMEPDRVEHGQTIFRETKHVAVYADIV